MKQTKFPNSATSELLNSASLSPYFRDHSIQGRQHLIQMVGLAHELGCHCVIRVLEKKMRLECGVASDLDLIVHCLCDPLR